MHIVRAYTFDFCGFISFAYTTLNTFLLYIIFVVLLKNLQPCVDLFDKCK